MYLRQPSEPFEIKGRTFTFTEEEGTIRVIFTEEGEAPREELLSYGFGWCDQLAAWVRLGGQTGREVAKSIARSWLEGERAWEAGDAPDPWADIIESDEEAEALDVALDECKKVFFIDDCFESDLSDLVSANAHDEDVIEFLAKKVNTLSLGESCTFYGGAGGDTEYRRTK